MNFFKKILMFSLAVGLLFNTTYVLSNTKINNKEFKAWIGECESILQGSSICYLKQAVYEDGHIILRSIIGYAPRKAYPTVFFELPPKIDTAAGVYLQVDKKKSIRFNSRCTEELCSAGFVLDPLMMKQFKKGKQLTLTYVPAPGQQPVKIPVSLMGVTAGIEALR